MRKPITVWVALCFCVLPLGVRAGDDLAKLGKARLDVAEKAYKAWCNGVRDETFTDMPYQLSVRWLNAELGLTDEKEERVAAFKAHLQRLKDWEKTCKAPMPRLATTIIEAYQKEAEFWLAEAKQNPGDSPFPPKRVQFPNSIAFPRLVKLDITEKPPFDPPWIGPGLFLGDLLQVFTVRPTQNWKKALKTITVEVTGDALMLVAVVEEPVLTDPSGNDPNRYLDRTKRNVTCFLKAIKQGNCTVKIVPVGLDGRDRPAQEYQISVFPRPKAEEPRAKNEPAQK